DVGRALIRNTKPLLIIHGEADDFVPVKMTDTNAESAKNCDLTVIKVPEADHGMSFITDETRVKAVLEWFLDKCINNYNNKDNSTNA
ncbi:MAG: alpha/beta hydrolase, partial [Clostridia bacterium]|nr:alpha/beta hydrolase [Clostridia bacterium]